MSIIDDGRYGDGSGDIDLIDVLINGLADLAKTMMPKDRGAFIQIVNDHFASVGMQVTTVSHNKWRRDRDTRSDNLFHNIYNALTPSFVRSCIPMT